MPKLNIGFIGAGGIARAHAYSLNALRFYYDDSPEIILHSVTSAREESRQRFAEKYGFHMAEDLKAFFANDALDAVFILGPNDVHYEHLLIALQMPNVKYIYLEKPVCASKSEERQMKSIHENLKKDIRIQVGFQYVLAASVRQALTLWHSDALGKPLHFDIKYYHADYLQKSYRDKRRTRLTPAPGGGAMADLGSHAVSLAMAFFGENLRIINALQAGHFKDVPPDSDLFSSIALIDEKTKAVGNLSASRISPGTGDTLSFELFAENGALRFSLAQLEYFDYFLEKDGKWIRQPVCSDFRPHSGFPSVHVPPGWLRSMIHAHYVFLTGHDKQAFIPDLKHGLAVQRIVRETATHLAVFRDETD